DFEQHIPEDGIAHALSELTLEGIPQAVERIPPAAIITAACSPARAKVRRGVNVAAILLQREVQVRAAAAPRRTDVTDGLPGAHGGPVGHAVAAEVVVARHQAVPNIQVQLIARRGVPGARSAATRHSEQGRPLGDGPIDALVPSAACPEAVAPGVRPAERAAELDQAAACVAPLHEVGEAAPTLSGLVGCQERLAAAA